MALLPPLPTSSSSYLNIHRLTYLIFAILTLSRSFRLVKTHFCISRMHMIGMPGPRPTYGHKRPPMLGDKKHQEPNHRQKNPCNPLTLLCPSKVRNPALRSIGEHKVRLAEAGETCCAPKDVLDAAWHESLEAAMLRGEGRRCSM